MNPVGTHRRADAGVRILAPSGLGAVLGLLLLTGCGYQAAVYGLHPVYPSVRMGPPFTEANGKLESPVVDYMHVWFKWEPFVLAPGHGPDLPGPTRITYDLRIWEARNGAPAALVYERKGLPEPRHELEKPLNPDTAYFWSVRARLEIGSEIRLTDWSRSLQPYNPRRPADVPRDIPPENYFRFVTSGY